MRTPRGFEEDKNPLLHRLEYGVGLGISDDSINTVFFPVVHSSNEMDVLADTIQVNPRNSGFEKDAGALCRQNSIIDRMRISLKFSLTRYCDARMESAATVFTGDNIQALHFLWRPIFNVYPEKMDAADEKTGDTVAAILGMTKDATFEDVVAVTTNNLPSTAGSKLHPMSSVNAVQVLTDYNMSGDIAMEDHVFDEDLLHTALRSYTNKGALRSCLGRTRHVTLTKQRPYKNFFIDKFVPNAIRRVQPYGMFGIQVHLYEDTDVNQSFITVNPTTGVAHLGIKAIINYHEWNNEFDQSM